MSTIKYQPVNASGDIVGQRCDSLSDAVLAAASYDGYGAEFGRDETGAMRLYSSAAHIGNNPYIRRERDAFGASSPLIDDDAAIDDVAAQVHMLSVLHSRYEMSIVELSYNEEGQLTHIGAATVERVAGDSDSTAEAVRAHYAGA